MTVEVRNAPGQPVTTADRSKAVAESLRAIARVSRFVDRKKGIRSYQSHVKRDPYIPILFVVFFLLPSALGIYYFGFAASDRFITESRFALRPAIGSVDKASPDQIGTGNGIGKQMLAQDSLITTSYILSRPMIEILAKQVSLEKMFSDPNIDFPSRFDASYPIEKLMKYWSDRVMAKIEPISGIITLTVNAFDPQDSLVLSQAILKESERLVNGLSEKARADAVAESQRELKIAEERMLKVRREYALVRNREGILDAQKTNDANLKTIGAMRSARINFAVQLAIGQRDLGPNSRTIQDIKSQIRDLDENIAKIERQSASQDPEQRQILANSLTAMEALDKERTDAESYYGKVLASNERARIIADRQIEFFSMIVEPVLPQSAQQPRRFLMTIMCMAAASLLFSLAVFTRKQMV